MQWEFPLLVSPIKHHLSPMHTLQKRFIWDNLLDKDANPR